MNDKTFSIQCKDDQELLEYLLTYFTASPYNYIILDQYPDGQVLSEEMIKINIAMAKSQGFTPVMAFRTCEQYYRSFCNKTKLTAVIPVNLMDH